MRPEPPAEFRPTVIEQLGLQQLFSPAGRIILRNVERQPMKASLTILGLSLAVAILVVGHSFSDAINYLIRVQFYEIQQEDITLIFTEPLSGSAQFDLRHLPGGDAGGAVSRCPRAASVSATHLLRGINGATARGQPTATDGS
jgi:putative ABC transport system permease protein